MATMKVIEHGMHLYNATHLYITPYTDSEGKILGEDTFDIRDVVADSVSIEQDDNETNSKDWEFGDTPVLENIKLGKYQFSATCIDFSHEILENVFGCHYDSTNKVTSFPTSYSDKYCLIRITFNDADDVILPRVLMNSKAVIGTLKTGSAEGTISGTAYTNNVSMDSTGSNPVETPMFFSDPTNVDSSTKISKWFIKSDTNGTITWKSVDYTEQ